MSRAQQQEEVIEAGAITFQKDSIIKLQEYIDRKIRLQFIGGRLIVGILKGYDVTNNLILDDSIEYIRSLDDPYLHTEQTRSLGLMVARGALIMSISSEEGFEIIENPFLQQE